SSALVTCWSTPRFYRARRPTGRGNTERHDSCAARFAPARPDDRKIVERLAVLWKYSPRGPMAAASKGPVTLDPPSGLDSLRFRALRATESLGSPFRFELELLSETAGID